MRKVFGSVDKYRQAQFIIQSMFSQWRGIVSQM